MAESKLTSALTAALQDAKSAGDKIQSVSKEAVRTASEAELIVRALKLFPLTPGSSGKRIVGSPLNDVVVWMQGTEAEEAIAVFRKSGAPELLRVFDDMLGAASFEDRLRTDNDLLFLLKIVCMYARKGAWSGSWLPRALRCSRTAICGRLSSAWSRRMGILGKLISSRRFATRFPTVSQPLHTWT